MTARPWKIDGYPVTAAEVLEQAHLISGRPVRFFNQARLILMEEGREVTENKDQQRTKDMNLPTPEQCNQAFDDAEEQFGDKSTDFLAQIAADRLGVGAHDILLGMAALADEKGVIPSSHK